MFTMELKEKNAQNVYLNIVFFKYKNVISA